MVGAQVTGIRSDFRRWAGLLVGILVVGGILAMMIWRVMPRVFAAVAFAIIDPTVVAADNETSRNRDCDVIVMIDRRPTVLVAGVDPFPVADPCGYCAWQSQKCCYRDRDEKIFILSSVILNAHLPAY